MALVKRRIYGEAPFGPTYLAHTPDPVLVAKHTAPHANDDTFLRLQLDFQLAVQVGSPSADVPPEDWWPRASATLILGWSPTGSSTPLPLNGTSEHYLGSRLLQPRLTHSPSDPTEYVVQWATEDPIITQTARRDVTATVHPTVTVGLYVNDPDTALDGTYTALNVTWYWRLFTLWGSLT
jgi:hypothetical protein